VILSSKDAVAAPAVALVETAEAEEGLIGHEPDGTPILEPVAGTNVHEVA
jgi:hypothetical protein